MMKVYPPGLVRLFTDPEALDNGLNAAHVKRLLEGEWPADKSDVNAWRDNFGRMLLADRLRHVYRIEQR